MITNAFTVEMAKAFNGTEDFSVPNYYAVDTSLSAANIADTALPGEKGARYVLSSTRDLNTVTYSGVRSGTAVTSYLGDNLTAFGMLSQSASGVLFTEIVVGTLSQSTNFDIETITTVTWNRQA